MLEALSLARAQFAFTVTFPFIFPSFSIGLASYLMVLEAQWLRTGEGVYANLYRYWLKIFAVMVALGLAILALGLAGLYARVRGRLYDWAWLHRAAVAMGPAGFLAVVAGWITTEVGRQPFTVYGLLTTAQSRSPLAAPAAAVSLGAFAVVYFCVFGAGVYYLLLMMSEPSHRAESRPPAIPQRAAGVTPASALSPAE